MMIRSEINLYDENEFPLCCFDAYHVSDTIANSAQLNWSLGWAWQRKEQAGAELCQAQLKLC